MAEPFMCPFTHANCAEIRCPAWTEYEDPDPGCRGECAMVEGARAMSEVGEFAGMIAEFVGGEQVQQLCAMVAAKAAAMLQEPPADEEKT